MNLLCRCLLVLIVWMCTLGGFSVSAEPAPESGRDFVEATQEYLDRLEKLGFAGSVLIARQDQVLLEGGYGLADRESDTPWITSTISTVGSITKQFTAAAVLSLEEDGRLRVEDPITKYFADVPSDKQEITLHQLLTHSSGIVDLDGAGDWDPIDRDTFIRRALEQELAFPPGTSYAYSNAGYSLLGAIIEQLTGESYERFVHERLFVPNGMEHTGYQLADWTDLPMAVGYSNGERWGTVLERPMAPDGPFWVLRANGGIHSNTGDLLRWANALLAGRVLSPASMEKLWAPHVDEGGGDSFYGYGWVVRTLPGGSRVITHDGGNGIYFADYAIVPETGLVTIVMTNVVSEVRASQGLLGRIGEFLLSGTPYPEVPDRIRVDSATLAGFAGTYRLDEETAFRVSVRDDELLVEPEGRQAFAILHSTRPLDRERTTRLSETMDRIVGASMNGDFEPLSIAYGSRVTPEWLESRWQAKLSETAEEMGIIQGYEILGSALRDERDVTVVRYSFERGHFDRAYVWTLDEDPALRGISMRGLDPQLRFVPVGKAAFGSWDGGVTASRELRFQALDAGEARMELGGGTSAVSADRERD